MANEGEVALELSTGELLSGKASEALELDIGALLSGGAQVAGCVGMAGMAIALVASGSSLFFTILGLLIEAAGTITALALSAIQLGLQ